MRIGVHVEKGRGSKKKEQEKRQEGGEYDEKREIPSREGGK